MKLPGFLLLVSGGVIAVVAVAILPSSGVRGAFVFAGLAIELVGLGLVIRSQMPVRKDRG
jgi:hypothetical protein